MGKKAWSHPRARQASKRSRGRNCLCRQLRARPGVVQRSRATAAVAAPLRRHLGARGLRRHAGGHGRRGDRRADRVERRGDRRVDQTTRRADRYAGNRNRTYTDRTRNGTYRDGYRDGRRADRRADRRAERRDHRRWDRRSWRNDRRYNWNHYRSSNRSIYRLGRYYAPYRGYSYRRLSIGFYLDSLFFGSRYYINDPWRYRLPEVYGPYRWVRYYDDVMLVDIYTGEVVDVIYDFFW